MSTPQQPASPPTTFSVKPAPASAGLIVGGLASLLVAQVLLVSAAFASLTAGQFDDAPIARLTIGGLLLVAAIGMLGCGLYFLLNKVDDALAKYLRRH